MNLVAFEEKNRVEYAKFLHESDFKDVLQSWEWGAVKSGFNWKVKRFGIFSNKELKGIFQLMERTLPLGFSVFYIPRGPIIDWDDKELVEESLRLIKELARESANFKKTLFLRIEPPVKADPEMEKIFRESGFSEYFKSVQPPSTLLIDLTPSEETLLKKFRRTARNLIYRSQREGVVVEPLAAPEISKTDLMAFYNLYRTTGKRFSFPLRPFRQFELIVKEMGNAGMLKFYIAKAKGLTLAYGIVVLIKDRAFYIWGGTGRHERFSKFFNYGYIWGMLKDLKKSGVRVFDFWGLGPLEKNHPWYGFSLFKTAFDGQRFNYLGAYDLPLSKLYPLFKFFDRIITPKYRATSS